MLGIKTIGNATLIAFDGAPVLATDPWLGGNDAAYFGSWNLSHSVPETERAEILSATYVWLSHGHPDHINGASLANLRANTLLLPDHVGGRIAADLTSAGFSVRIMPDRQWIDLSPRIKACCITTAAQDAILLVDVGGRLFVNLNDAGATGCTDFIRRVVAGYRDSYLMAVACSDADMINFVDEAGRRTTSHASFKSQPGPYLSRLARSLGIRHVIPFSSFHRYQRSDSAWANAFTTPLAEYPLGFGEGAAHLLPAFVWVDCEKGDVRELAPPVMEDATLPPETFGDNWGDVLERDDWQHVERYIREREMLSSSFGFIGFRVGGKEHAVRLSGPAEQGIWFEAPRHSLMEAVRHEIFDDLLIGNFVRTQLCGVRSLYDPNFNFIVAKYADNGRAKTAEEVKEYLKAYRRRVGLKQTLLDQFGGGAKRTLRRLLDPRVFNRLRAVYYRFG